VTARHKRERERGEGRGGEGECGSDVFYTDITNKLHSA